MNQESHWAEIRSDYIEEADEDFHVLHIDSWKTSGDTEEEGKVIAKLVGISKDGKPHIYVSYEDPDARIDPLAQEVIKEADQKLRDHLNKQVKGFPGVNPYTKR
jgi:hypothetical protein